MNGHHSRRLILATLLSLGLTSAPTQAEDIEVFFNDSANNVAPNVLFILDSSGSMNDVDGMEGTRMDVLQNSLEKVLLPDQKYKALNVGIMDFSGNSGGGIDFPITDINSEAQSVDPDIPANTDVGTVLDYISESYTASGKTPMGDALYFASSYFSGAKIYNTGWRGRPNSWDTSSNKYTGGQKIADNPAAYENGSWITTSKEISFTESHDCSESLPSTDVKSCFNARFSPFDPKKSCEDNPAKARYCYVEERICDSTGKECSWKRISTVNPVIGSDPIDPDGDGNNFRVRCWGPYAANRHCHGTEAHTKIKTISGFDTTPTYKTPITQQCQSNYVVLLSDGEPTRLDTRHYIASRASAVIGSNRFNDCADIGSAGSNIRNYGRCLPELIQYMAEYDQADDLDGDQTISTYTIGFMLDGNAEAEDFLTTLAAKSKGYGRKEGKYFSAKKSSDLVDIFKRIINEVTNEDVSFAAPAISIDQNNRLATSEFVYRTEFTPKEQPLWSGNVIKAKIDATSATGFTDEDITLASVLNPSTRNLYTYTGTAADLAGTAADLANSSNAITAANTDLTLTLLGLDAGTSADYRKNLIDWARGVDVDNGDVDRKFMGDSLHTTPAMVSYANAGGTSKQVLFVTTNEGLLHAFDVTGDTPSELFAFMPQALLKNLNDLYVNAAGDKIYGLDGNMTIWQTADKTYLYFGMRRGGRDYYALDVTDITGESGPNPKLLWHIEGGTSSNDKGDFTALGQTWSTPQLTYVKVGETKTLALIFGGGYDTNQDTAGTTRSDDTVGQGIFIVNALTGAKIWSAGTGNSHNVALAGMTNSIPSDVRIIDLDGNSMADRLYVGDTGGRVWRVDLDQSDITKSSGYALADFNGGNAAGNRRFYYPPSVSFDRSGRLMVVMGSGYRAHPAESTTADRFYAFVDENAKIGKPGTTPSALTENNLGDITNDLSGAAAFDNNVVGWRLSLNPSEKVLAEPIIFDNDIVFTSYQPVFDDGNATCNLSGNVPRAYMLALSDGRPVTQLSTLGADATTDPFALDDRFYLLKTVKFIPGSPYVTISKKPDSTSQADAPQAQVAADVYKAGLYANGTQLKEKGFMSERISWQNQ